LEAKKQKGEISTIFFLIFFQRIFSNTLLRIIAPIDTSEIEFWVGNPGVALFAASADIVFKKFCGCKANGTINLKDGFFFPVASILSRTFHLVIILFILLSYFNKTKVKPSKRSDFSNVEPEVQTKPSSVLVQPLELDTNV